MNKSTKSNEGDSNKDNDQDYSTSDLANQIIPLIDKNVRVNEWPDDVDIILEKIRCNSIIMADYHKTNYFILHSRLKYFRIPIIIISAFASVLNIGLQPFLDQQYVSILCCLLSLITGLIGSIEMFLQVQKKMENELINSRDFYLNAIEIFKVLSLEPIHRNGDGLKFLDAKFGVYIKMIENSNIMEKDILDQLAPIDPKMIQKYVGNLNNAGIVISSTAHKVQKKIKKRVKKIGKLTITDLLFMRFFWGSGAAIEDDSSVDSEDRFHIYYDLIQKVNNNDINPDILAKLGPILTFKNIDDDIGLDERMKIYSYLVESNKFDPQIMLKIRSILIEEFFRNPSKTKKRPNTLGHNSTSYNTSNSNNTEVDNKFIYQNMNEICDIENNLYDRAKLNTLRPLHYSNMGIRKMSSTDSSGNHVNESLFISGNNIDDDMSSV